MQAAATFILGNIYLMRMEKPNDESYMGSWPKAGNDDTSHGSRSLEEELERIIQLADNMSEKAESTAENYLDFPSDKRRKGKRNAKKSALTSLVFGKRRTSLRSDKLSMRQPRLSPLAARAALAAAVTPLRQASQAGFSGKPQILNAHLATGKADVSYSKNEKKDGGIKKVPNSAVPLRRDHRAALACKKIVESPVKETGSLLHSATGKADASSSKNEKKDGRIKKVQNSAVPIRRDHRAALARKKIIEPPAKETGPLPLNQYGQDIQLIVDIPVYKDNYAEKALNLTIDVAFLER